MNASEYYARNAQLHPCAAHEHATTLPTRLGPSPSEPDITLFKHWRPSLFGGDLLVMAEPCEPEPQLPINF